MVIVYAINGDTAADSLAREDAARRYPGEPVGGRNPQFYGNATAAPVRDARAVYVHERWAAVIADYERLGIPVHVIETLLAPAPAPAAAPPPPAPPIIERTFTPTPTFAPPPMRRPVGRPRKVPGDG